MAKRPPPDPSFDALQRMRPVVLSAYKGQDVRVDPNPRCPACGKRLGEYFGLPWSIKCRNCGHQATRE